MSILDENPTKTGEYRFASDGLSEFMDDFQTPKQEQNIVDDFSELEGIVNDEPDNDEPEPEIKTSARVAKVTAHTATTLLETITVIGLDLVDQDESNHFTPDERQTIESSLADYFRLNGVKDIPPGWILAITIALVLGQKTTTAFQRKKEKREIDRLKADIARLTEENEQLKVKQESEQ